MFECICVTGIDFCKSKPCLKGMCVNLIDKPGYTCMCDNGYTGKHCDKGMYISVCIYRYCIV